RSDVDRCRPRALPRLCHRRQGFIGDLMENDVSDDGPYESDTEDRLPAQRAVLPSQRHDRGAGAEPAPRQRRAVRHGAGRGAVPLRRFEEQAVLRRLALADRLPRPGRRSAMITGGYATVYITDMDRAVAFYVDVLALKLEQRFGNHWAEVRAGDNLLIGLHPKTDH